MLFIAFILVFALKGSFDGVLSEAKAGAGRSVRSTKARWQKKRRQLRRHKNPLVRGSVPLMDAGLWGAKTAGRTAKLTAKAGYRGAKQGAKRGREQHGQWKAKPPSERRKAARDAFVGRHLRNLADQWQGGDAGSIAETQPAGTPADESGHHPGGWYGVNPATGESVWPDQNCPTCGGTDTVPDGDALAGCPDGPHDAPSTTGNEAPTTSDGRTPMPTPNGAAPTGEAPTYELMVDQLGRIGDFAKRLWSADLHDVHASPKDARAMAEAAEVMEHHGIEGEVDPKTQAALSTLTQALLDFAALAEKHAEAIQAMIDAADAIPPLAETARKTLVAQQGALAEAHAEQPNAAKREFLQPA